MTPLKHARIIVCRACPSWRQVQGAPWPRCGADNRELDDGAFDGPDSDCPAGRWAAADVAAAAEQMAAWQAMPKRFETARAPQRDIVAERSAICDACDGVTENGGKCAFKDCKPCRKASMLGRPGMACPADPPRWLPVAAPVPLKIAWVLAARNEGDEVARTVKSLHWCVVRPGTELMIIVVDEASQDGSFVKVDGTAVHIPAHVIRNATPVGTAVAQAQGIAAAFEWGAEVVGFSDAHMRFDPEALERLADKALAERCLAQGISRGFDLILPVGLGCRLIRNGGIIEAKWYDPPLSGEWARIPAPMGACLAASRETIAYMSGPTGRFWDNVAAPWGYQEETLAVKAALMDVPIYVSTRWGACHLYRNVNPFSASWSAKNLNIGWATALLFSPETYDAHFRKVVERILGPAVERSVVREAAKAITRPWSPADEERFLATIPEIPTEGDVNAA